MVEIFIKINSKLSGIDEINTKLSLLPKQLQLRISKYTFENKKQQRIDGFELLIKALTINGFNTDDYLETIKYSPFGKPFFNDEMDFSVSYSQNKTILAFIKKGLVGVDIENIKKIDLHLYKDYFSSNEWSYINSIPNGYTIFYKLWTRKEAVAKAIGKGTFLDFNSIDVLNDEILIENKKIYLFTDFITNEYCFSIASTTNFIGKMNEFYYL